MVPILGKGKCFVKREHVRETCVCARTFMARFCSKMAIKRSKTVNLRIWARWFAVATGAWFMF